MVLWEGWLNKKSFSFFLLGNVIENFTIWNCLETISMIPLVTNNNFIFQRIFLCKILGVDALKKFGSVVSLVNRGLNHHFSILTKDLEAYEVRSTVVFYIKLKSGKTKIYSQENKHKQRTAMNWVSNLSILETF